MNRGHPGHQGKFLVLAAAEWEIFFQNAARKKMRFAGLWAEEWTSEFNLIVCLEFSGQYFLYKTILPPAAPEIASIAAHYPAANRFEKHAHDMLGIHFIGATDNRRWTRHQAWPATEFPLRKDFSLPNSSQPTPADVDYMFTKVKGAAVYEIPVGPVHAGIIEPGHFRFQVAGEDVILLEERLGYTHRGIEKLAVGKSIPQLIKLAARISGDSAVAHAWAACQACENAYEILPSERAVFMRAILAERERVANHLGDMAAICNDVAFSFPYYQLMRLKEIWLRLNQQVFGHRLLMDSIEFGGVKKDLTTEQQALLKAQCLLVQKELATIFSLMEENSALHDRLKNTGILSVTTAQNLGALGYVGRASGLTFDLRHDSSYAPYDKLKVHVPIYTSGDVLARTRIRAQEILVALDLLLQLLTDLPGGEVVVNIENIFTEKHLTDSGCKKGIWEQSPVGIGLIEGWRGEILTYVRFDATGKVTRFFPRDPSWFNWLALEKLIHGNIVPDFPVCNKSVNASYAGCDL